MKTKNHQASRWMSVLLPAGMHRGLTIKALDTKVALAELVRSILAKFLVEYNP